MVAVVQQRLATARFTSGARGLILLKKFASHGSTINYSICYHNLMRAAAKHGYHYQKEEPYVHRSVHAALLVRYSDALLV